MARILGLDLGTNSIGWAVVDTKKEKPILQKGVHIFPEGVKFEKGIESSKAAERTGFRSARRLKFRRKLRKYETLKALIKHEMCPLTIEELEKWRRYKSPDTNKNETFKHYPASKEFLRWLSSSNQSNPYYFRDKAAREKLPNKYEIGRALYHLAQRRGFLSNRLEKTDETLLEEIKNEIIEVLEDVDNYTLPQLQTTLQEIFQEPVYEDSEDKEVGKLKRTIEKALKKNTTKETTLAEIEKILNKEIKLGPVAGGIRTLTEKIFEANCETLGQYFFKLFQNNIQETSEKEKIRGLYTAREEHYLKEFHHICATQEFDSKTIQELERAIFFQRPLKSQKGLVGKCSFEKSKPRCPVSHPAFEEYRALSYVNTIKYRKDEKDDFAFLTKEQKEFIWHLFTRKSKPLFNFSDIAKEIHPDFSDGDYDRKHFNYKAIDTVSGCPTIAGLKYTFGENWKKEIYNRYTNKQKKNGVKTENEVINDIWHVLFTFDKREKLEGFAKTKLSCDEKTATKFGNIKLKREYASLSLSAINKILPFLRDGLLFSHAAFLANMPDVVGNEIWNNEKNRKIIQNEIENIINTYSEQKRKVGIINSLLTKIRGDKKYFPKHYSIDAQQKEEIQKVIHSVYGEITFNEFSKEKQNEIISFVEVSLLQQIQRGEYLKLLRLDDMIIEFLKDNFNPSKEKLEKLFHPSDIETYKEAPVAEDGKRYLGSPIIASIKNPMAMRALHQLRKLVNELIKEDIIDSETRIHIELARELNDANKRQAIKRYQDERKALREKYREAIKADYKAECGKDIEPTDDDILKYELWEEQKHRCVYTGQNIGICEFIGDNPLYDIEHTLPRSQSQDNSMMNKTLANKEYNRQIKGTILPINLPNRKDSAILKLANKEIKCESIESSIEHWKEEANKFEILVNKRKKPKGFEDKEKKDKRIKEKHYYKMYLDYWRGKYERFEKKEIPQGFKNSQLVDTGIITKYARAYLKSVFPLVHSIKGEVVSEFRKIWGVQPIYSTKERTNHVHHCIDAITIASLTKDKYDELARSWREDEEQRFTKAREIRERSKPWETFVQDIKEVENEVLVSHYTPNNTTKQTKKKLRVRGKVKYHLHSTLPEEFQNKKEGKDYFKIVKDGEIQYKLPIYLQGDTVRGSLHKDTFYGAIMRKDDDGNEQVRYVIRKELSKLEESDIEKIVDPIVKKIIQQAIQEHGLKKVTNGEIKVWMNEEKNIQIKKVRCFAPSVKEPLHIKTHRDKSKFEYKNEYHVANDENYGMAIYESIDENGKAKRESQLIKMLDAGKYFRLSNCTERKEYPIVEETKNGLKLKTILKKGLLVLLYEHAPEEIWDMSDEMKLERLFEITQLDTESSGIKLLFHQEARETKEITKHMGLKTGMKGGKNIGKHKEFPWIKISPNNFDALIQGIDFEITVAGEIKRLK